MRENTYKLALFLYSTQLILLVVLINYGLMKQYDFFRPVNEGTFELLLGIVIFALNILAIFTIRSIYITSQEAQQHRIMALKFKHITEQNRIYRQHQHDFKNHLSIMISLFRKKEFEKLEEYLAAYTKEIEEIKLKVTTGVEEIDILLNSKIYEAKSKDIQIDFQCETSLKCHKKHVLHLISILSNVLDNAIEACQTLTNDVTPKIWVEIGEDPIDYIFKVTNTLGPDVVASPETLFQEGFTTKEGEGRGEGLAIVKSLVAKLGGEVRIEAKDIFVVNIEIPKYKLGA